MEFTETRIERYSRHILLPEIGGAGQQKLAAASIALVGAGGLGSVMALYLAAAGVGRIGLIDDDRVSLSNLQRQILFNSHDLDRPKVESGAEHLHALNPDVQVDPLALRLTPENARNVLSPYGIVADGSDNFDTRYCVNAACVALGKPLVSAAVLRFDGQLATFRPGAGSDSPCYRCLFPVQPPADLIPSCSQAGVLGALVGVMGSLQATEVIKEILGIGDSQAGWLTLYDGLGGQFRRMKVKRNPDCPDCGNRK